MNDIAIDPVAVAVALIATLIGPRMAAYVGPYIVIAAAGLTGAAFSLARRDPDARMGPFMFLAVMVGFSMLLTVPAAAGLGILWPGLDQRWMLAPMALVIGYIGDEWPALFRWVAERAGRLIERRTGSGQ